MTAPGIRILVVDDDSFTLKLVARMVANLGHADVTTCERARLALERLDAAKDPPDIVLLDLNMPDMDGIEFVRQLGERRFAGGLILMSGEDLRVLQAAENLVEQHRLRLLGRLHKPVVPEALSALLEQRSQGAARAARPRATPFSADELRRAIRDGELVNHYQPKVAVASGQIMGVETLVRWQHPTAGLVFPDRFIGVAEEHGLIDDLTRAVLTAAVAQTRTWRDAGLEWRVAVNVSMDNLTALDFPEFVSGLADAVGVAPGAIILEVTESRLQRDARAALDIVTRLRLRRFGLSIDDFGTGHSSLAQLRDMPFDELKVDRSFVHGAARDSTARAIFEASLGMARQLGMKVVAEGVEDPEDWRFLEQAGCDFAQGYFVGKPMTVAALADWAAQWHDRSRELRARS